jgi:hypothetical protein
MDTTRLLEDRPAETAREQAHLRIVERLLEELGDKADDHCLTMTYYLVRAGHLADERLVLHFASRAAQVALDHGSYYVAGRYFEAAARAGARSLSPDECASLHCKAGDAFRRWSDPTPSIECYREAARMYGEAGNQTGRTLALEAMREGRCADKRAGEAERRWNVGANAPPFNRDPSMYEAFYAADGFSASSAKRRR